jgi:hypothetical protein
LLSLFFDLLLPSTLHNDPGKNQDGRRGGDHGMEVKRRVAALESSASAPSPAVAPELELLHCVKVRSPVSDCDTNNPTHTYDNRTGYS